MRRFIIVSAIAGFIADRLLKYYFQNLPEGTVFSFLPGVEFGNFLNPSLFFFPAWGWIPWLALAVLIMLATYYILHITYRSALLPILFGGISNVFDRFAYGGVVDYVEILGLATINLADILILLGLVVLLLQINKSSN